MILYIISTDFISIIYAEIFELNEEDYYGSDKSISEKNSANSEDNDKENCINNQVQSVLASNGDINSDSYSSEFHFIKKFDREGNLVDSWGTVGF